MRSKCIAIDPAAREPRSFSRMDGIECPSRTVGTSVERDKRIAFEYRVSDAAPISVTEERQRAREKSSSPFSLPKGSRVNRVISDHFARSGVKKKKKMPTTSVAPLRSSISPPLRVPVLQFFPVHASPHRPLRYPFLLFSAAKRRRLQPRLIDDQSHKIA